MIVFDQLRVSDDGNHLIIAFHVNTAAYFDNVYLKEMTIQTADYVSETNPEIVSSDYIYKITFDDDQKYAEFALDRAAFDAAFTHTSTDGSTATIAYSPSNMRKDMFFVYVKVQGTPSECTPCELDKEVTLGVTFDDTPFHNLVMQYTRELANTCEIPKGFIDVILQWFGLKSALETGHYIPAIDMWKKLYLEDNGTGVFKTIKKCGCHG